nr:hypothetical protein [uncultured Actinoplanes sp.]
MVDSILARAAALGFAAGGRSLTPLAVLALRRRDWITAVAAAAAAGELVVDKLPSTPSRLQPAPLGGRFVLGAVAGVLCARSRNTPVAVPALVAGVAALAGSYAGSTWRSYRPGAGAALAEDAATIGLALTAAEFPPAVSARRRGAGRTTAARIRRWRRR